MPVSRNVLNSLLTPRFVQRFSRNSSVNLFAVYPFKYKLLIKISSLLMNTMLIVDKHCSDICYDEFSMPQIDRKSSLNNQKNSDMKNWKTSHFKHRKFQSLWTNNKVKGD